MFKPDFSICYKAYASLSIFCPKVFCLAALFTKSASTLLCAFKNKLLTPYGRPFERILFAAIGIRFPLFKSSISSFILLPLLFILSVFLNIKASLASSGVISAMCCFNLSKLTLTCSLNFSVGSPWMLPADALRSQYV